MSAASTLRVQAPPRWSRLTWIVAVVALLGVVAWYATHPSPLPAPGEPVEATTPADAAVYVGMVEAGDRTVHLRTVDVPVEGGEARAMICRSGSLAVTTEAAAFCSALDDAEGATLEPGDQLVLELRGEAGDTVTTEAVAVDYREGMQFGEATTGRPATVTVLE